MREAKSLAVNQARLFRRRYPYTGRVESINVAGVLNPNTGIPTFRMPAVLSPANQERVFMHAGYVFPCVPGVLPYSFQNYYMMSLDNEPQELSLALTGHPSGFEALRLFYDIMLSVPFHFLGYRFEIPDVLL